MPSRHIPRRNPRLPAAGLEPDWDIAVVLQEIGAHAERLVPVLNQLDAHAWVAKGASDTFVDQLESSRQQALAVAGEAKALARNPEKLSGGLQLFFRIEGLETMVASLQEGARKYQGPQAAQSLAAVYGEGGANRERFRSYIVNLAAEREHQFKSWIARPNAAGPPSWRLPRPPRPQEGRSNPHAVHLQYLWRGIHPDLRALHQGRLRQPSLRKMPEMQRLLRV